MDNKPFLVIVLDIAFVALVLPFDSFRGLREQTRSLFFGLEAVTELGRPSTGTKRGKAISISRFSSEGTRNSEVVQCFEGLRVHPAPNR